LEELGVDFVCRVAIDLWHICFVFPFADLANVSVDHVLKAVDVNLILKFFVCCDNVSVVLQRRHSHIDHFLVGSTLLPGTIVQIYLLALDLRLNFLKETFHLDLL